MVENNNSKSTENFYLCSLCKASIQSEDKLKTQGELFEEFYSGITLHGFRFLFEGKWIRRLIWLIICSCVFGFSMHLSYGLLEDFFNRKMNTGVTRTYTQSSLDFPTVTLCPLNPQSSQKLNNLPLENYTAESFLAAERNLIVKQPNNESRKFLNELKNIKINSLTDLIELHQLSYEEFVTSCSFFGRDCNATWFVRRFNWGQNLCIEFNSFNAEKSPLKAPIRTNEYFYTGLVLYLDFGAVDQSIRDAIAGALLNIENYGNREDELILNEKITLNTGEITHIKLTEKEFKMLQAHTALIVELEL